MESSGVTDLWSQGSLLFDVEYCTAVGVREVIQHKTSNSFRVFRSNEVAPHGVFGYSVENDEMQLRPAAINASLLNE